MRLLIVLLGGAAVLGCRTASGQSTLFDQARRCFERQEWDCAREYASRALAADPRMADAETLLGLVATVQSQFPEAEKHFLKAAELAPGNDRVQAYLGSTYLQEKRLREAESAFRQALEWNPRNLAARYNLGLIALEKDAPGDALAHFEAVAQARPADIPAAIGRLECLLLLRRGAAARTVAQSAAGLLPDNDPRLFQMGTLLARHGESAVAVPLLERTLRAFPDSYDAAYNLALACFQTGQFNRAAAALQPFAARAEALNLLGAAEEKRGRWREAESAFEEAARREPANEDFRFDYGNALAQHGNLDAALAAFEAAAADLPRSWKLRVGLGSVAYLRGHYERAAEVLLEAVKLKPDALPAYFLLGEAYESADRLQPAIESALAAYLKTSPADPWAYCHYAAILSAREDYSAALRNLDQALRRDPGFAEAHYRQGLILLAQGHTERGVAALEKSVALDPKLVTAHYRLGQEYQHLGRPELAKKELDLFRALKDEQRSRGRVLSSLSSLARPSESESRSPLRPASSP